MILSGTLVAGTSLLDNDINVLESKQANNMLVKEEALNGEITKLVLGGDYSAMTTIDYLGTSHLYTWGNDDHAQLENGDTRFDNVTTPMEIDLNGDVTKGNDGTTTKLSLGEDFSAASTITIDKMEIKPLTYTSAILINVFII